MTLRHYFEILLFVVFPILVNAQQPLIDSLRNDFQKAPDGERRYIAARSIYRYYDEHHKDSAFYYAEQSLLIAQKNHHKIAEGFSLNYKSFQLMGVARYADALQCLLQAFQIAEDKENENKETWDVSSPASSSNFNGNKRLLLLSFTHNSFGNLMFRTGNVDQAILHYKEAGRIAKMLNYPPRVIPAIRDVGGSYLRINEPDSALYFEKEAERICFQSGVKFYLPDIDLIMGDIYQAQQNQSTALQYYYAGLAYLQEYYYGISLGTVYLRLTKYHLAQGNADSALYYATRNLLNLKSLGIFVGREYNFGTVYENLYQSYNLKGKFDSAFKYQGLALAANDSISRVSIKNLSDFQNLSFKEQLRLQDLEKEKIAYQNKIRTWSLLAGIGFLLILAIIFYRNNRQKNKANIILQKTLSDLRSTQTQLIQSEKMASLGEMTAGIAHEIQNPLNFVNNFSEVNAELGAELKEQIQNENYREVKRIAAEMVSNEQKIIQHGKRADNIVKNMLLHSRTSSGQKEITDINSLANEYLRLSYHGLRAKDNAFSATVKTEFDDSIGSINIVPQDIGRVLLNLYNNAFYAVTEKKKQALEGYEPTINVATKKLNGKVVISVKDNGDGIPQKVIDKIFQPFFTTKPAGHGTGLGLSMSYDIMKAHGGEISVNSKEGVGVEFIIQLPDKEHA
jgi:signal transduction histidine kinase